MYWDKDLEPTLSCAALMRLALSLDAASSSCIVIDNGFPQISFSSSYASMCRSSQYTCTEHHVRSAITFILKTWCHASASFLSWYSCLNVSPFLATSRGFSSSSSSISVMSLPPRVIRVVRFASTIASLSSCVTKAYLAVSMADVAQLLAVWGFDVLSAGWWSECTVAVVAGRPESVLSLVSRTHQISDPDGVNIRHLLFSTGIRTYAGVAKVVGGRVGGLVMVTLGN